MKHFVTQLMPNTSASLISYGKDLEERTKLQSNINLKEALTEVDNFCLKQIKKARDEKIKLMRQLTSWQYRNDIDAQGLLDKLFLSSSFSLDSICYIDPAAAIKHQTNWATLLFNKNLNNPNIVYRKITDAKFILTNDLNMSVMNQHKSKFQDSLIKHEISKAACSFDLKVSYSRELKSYVHNFETHLFFDLRDKLKREKYYSQSFQYDYREHKYTSQKVFNDIHAYAGSLKPFSSRRISQIEHPDKPQVNARRFADPCLHLNYIFASLSFEDRLLIHGQSLRQDAKGEYFLQ